MATRYATALVDVALEHQRGNEVKRDLDAWAEVYAGSADLRNFLESPAVDREDKLKVIEQVAAKMKLEFAVRNFAMLLMDRGRTELLGEIRAAFGAQLNARLGIAEAEIVTAEELSAAEKQELTAALERRTGKKIEAKFVEDEALLGGAVVRVGSTIYDGSVREQLTRLREQLEGE